MLSRLENFPFIASVALGTATNHSVEENLDDVIALADIRMDDDKRQMKSNPRIKSHVLIISIIPLMMLMVGGEFQLTFNRKDMVVIISSSRKQKELVVENLGLN